MAVARRFRQVHYSSAAAARRDRKPQVALGDLPSLLFPEGRIVRAPVGEDGIALCRLDVNLLQALQFGKGWKLVRRLAFGCAFHLADRDMHPRKGNRDDDKEQHKAACPEAGLVQKHAEQDRQDEAAKTADHAHQTADGAEAKPGPVGTQKAAIQNYIDEDKFWKEIVVPLTTGTKK